MAVSAGPGPATEAPLDPAREAEQQHKATASRRAWASIARLRPRRSPARPDRGRPANLNGAANAAATATNATREPVPAGRLGVPPPPVDLQGDRRGFMLRRWLLVADVAGFVTALSVVEQFGGFVPRGGHDVLFDLACFVVAVPAWLVLLRAYGLYHIDSRRADHGVSEEIAPMLQMTALASWSLLLVCWATGLAQPAV